MTRAHSWLRRPSPRPGARLRLLCFPHAGAGAGAFRHWAAALPPTVELVVVQYPGREDRIDEPPVDDFAAVVDAVTAELPAYTALPYALFGHSMGAALAHEVAVAARDRGLAGPTALLVSGREAPTRIRPADVHTRDDAGLCAELVRVGGMAPELLAHAELRDLVLPVVRNDYRLIETYVPTAHAPLGCPVTALIGADDPEVDRVEAQAWAAVSTGPFRLRTFPGDHFFLVTDRARVIAAVAEALGAVVAAP